MNYDPKQSGQNPNQERGPKSDKQRPDQARPGEQRHGEKPSQPGQNQPKTR